MISKTDSIFQLIDFDRTLFNTSLFTKKLMNLVDAKVPGLGTELDEKFEEAYKNEVTFFVLRDLRDRFGDTEFETMVHELMSSVEVDYFLLPGARERLAYAKTIGTAPSHSIFTYGDKDDQLMKIRLAGFADEPVFITDTPDKSAVIASWKTESGAFQLPDVLGGGEVAMVSLEDDKLRAFVNMPEGMMGFWVTSNPDAISLAAQQNVTPVKDLHESMQALKRHLSH